MLLEVAEADYGRLNLRNNSSSADYVIGFAVWTKSEPGAEIFINLKLSIFIGNRDLRFEHLNFSMKEKI